MKQINHEPWNIAFSERLRKINQIDSKKKVVYIYEKADTSTFRYRAYNPCQALNDSISWAGSYFFENELPILEKSLKSVNVVVFCRTPWSHTFDIFFHKAKKYKIPTVFDVDDLVFNIEKIPMIMNTLGLEFCYQNYQYWFTSISRHWLMGKLCDFTFATNEFLCEQLRQTFDKPSFVSNNFLNNEQIELSKNLFNEKIVNKKQNSNFKIGYFSGTPTHRNDFNRIVMELSDLLDQYPEITLEIVGFMDIPKCLLKHFKEKQVFLTPLVDFLTLQKKIAHVDVNIVPLIDNVFTNCKSELKFFEAAIVGTITCATPIYTFKNNIQNKISGFLCQEGEWYGILEKIYKKEFDPTMIKQAHDYCLKKYSPQAQCYFIENSLESVYS